jgi:transposase-like protein
MDTHNNARLTPRGREDMARAVVDRGLSRADAARQLNASWKAVDKWVNRFRALGVEGLRDHSSRPHSLPSQTPLATADADAVEAARRDRHTQSHIAAELRLSTATVSRICRARGFSRLDAIEPKEPRPRYERAAPGEIVHIDITKARQVSTSPGHRVTGIFPGHARSDSAGYEFAHVAGHSIDKRCGAACRCRKSVEHIIALSAGK